MSESSPPETKGWKGMLKRLGRAARQGASYAADLVYQNVVKPSIKIYQRSIAPVFESVARAAYQRTSVAADLVYQNVVKPSIKIYQRSIAPVLEPVARAAFVGMSYATDLVMNRGMVNPWEPLKRATRSFFNLPPEPSFCDEVNALLDLLERSEAITPEQLAAALLAAEQALASYRDDHEWARLIGGENSALPGDLEEQAGFFGGVSSLMLERIIRALRARGFDSLDAPGVAARLRAHLSGDPAAERKSIDVLAAHLIAVWEADLARGRRLLFPQRAYNLLSGPIRELVAELAKPAAEAEAPAPAAEDPEPAAAAEDPEPAPAAEDPEPAAAAEDPEPAPAAEDPEPEAAAEDPEPAPAAEDPAPEAEDPAPAPAAEDPEPGR